MLRVIIIFFVSTIILSSCANDPNGFLKRSANNKLFDTKGFEGGKRAPLYNKKYIDQAKKNIIKGDYEIDEDDYENPEQENISKENIEMYKELIKKDLEENYQKKKGSKNKKKSFPSLINSKKNTESEEHFLNLELKDELEQIKLLLDETRRELENNAKCPCAIDKFDKIEINNDSNVKPISEIQTIDNQSAINELEANLDKFDHQKVIDANYTNKFQPSINEDQNFIQDDDEKIKIKDNIAPKIIEHEHIQSL